jgi:hypothetical protein
MTLGAARPSEQDESRQARCGECGQRVADRGGSPRDHQRSAAAAQGSPARWHLAMGQVVQGPFTREQVLELRARGACDASTLVHRSGWHEWRSLESIAVLLGGDRAPQPAPSSDWQLSNAGRILERARFHLAAMRVAFDAVISGTLRGFLPYCAAFASRLQLTALAGLDRASFAFERAGQRLRTQAESLHPEVLLGFAVLGFMTVVGNVIGLVLVAVTTPLAAQAQAVSRDGAEVVPTAVAAVAAPEADPLFGRDELPGLPSRDQVLEALSGPRTAIAMCTGRGTARVSLNVRGGTGRVSTIAVEGVTPKSRACVQRALRKTVFPRFRQANLRVRVPFRLEQS